MQVALKAGAEVDALGLANGGSSVRGWKDRGFRGGAACVNCLLKETTAQPSGPCRTQA